MSQRYYRIGSIYGSRWFNRRIFTNYGLPQEQRIQHKQWPIVSGDTVQVIEGPEKGKVGQVIAVLRPTNQIVIKDVNIHIRTHRATPVRGGFFFKTESPIHYTNVQLIDPIHNKPCKIRFGKDESGHNVRYSSLSGAVIPKKKVEYKKKDKSKNMNKKVDTKPEDVWEVTFKPFERNWKPHWTLDHSITSPKVQQFKQNVAKLDNFNNSKIHQPIAHL